MSNNAKDFLFELGTEELPPKALKKLATSLVTGVETQLKELNISYDKAKWFASPRRLAFVICNLDEYQDDIVIEKQGPLLSIAYKDGEPSKVGLGFANSCGVDISELETIETPKGDKLFYKAIQKGEKVTNLMQDIISKPLKQLPIPKMMRWGSSEVEFVRPVHWVLALYGTEIVELDILEHKSSNITYGHRFHCPQSITINSINEYIDSLKKAMVIADWDERKQLIIEQASTIAANDNYKVVLEDDLVEEVCAIVEYPNAMLCNFSDDFLRVPQEALISSMEEHQKCFALLDNNNNLVSKFITISNIISTKPELVVSGNQKVMNARLSDAAFFYDTDLKKSMDSFITKLETVTFHNQLGNMLDRAKRIGTTAKVLAEISGQNAEDAYRAGMLAKADLASDMVFEFTDLQGIIGKYYAKAQGESDVVAEAIEQQYWPKYSGAELPVSEIACCVSLAEKLDTLVGIFAIGQKPTGNKDPFALRRAAIGILRILRDTKIDISIGELIDTALNSYQEISNLSFDNNVKVEIHGFFNDRLKNLYKDEGISADIFESVNVTNYSTIKDFDSRIKAISAFKELQNTESLIQSDKRVANILNKNIKDASSSYDINISKNNPFEISLANKMQDVSKSVIQLLENRNYNEALVQLSTLDKVITEFFDNVMVMDEDTTIRANRLALLQNLHHMFTSVADISKLS